jgi:hypothetical protein
MSAALLWSAQGEIMMSYPLEKDKGKAFSIFWAIFQFGTFIGSVIALAINIKSGQLLAVSTSTYVVSSNLIFYLFVWPWTWTSIWTLPRRNVLTSSFLHRLSSLSSSLELAPPSWCSVRTALFVETALSSSSKPKPQSKKRHPPSFASSLIGACSVCLSRCVSTSLSDYGFPPPSPPPNVFCFQLLLCLPRRPQHCQVRWPHPCIERYFIRGWRYNRRHHDRHACVGREPI